MRVAVAWLAGASLLLAVALVSMDLFTPTSIWVAKRAGRSIADRRLKELSASLAARSAGGVASGPSLTYMRRHSAAFIAAMHGPSFPLAGLNSL